MTTSRLTTLILPLLWLLTGFAYGDEPRKATPRAEKVARASWTPVREANSAKARTKGSVVRAQAVEETENGIEDLPAPEPDRSIERTVPHAGGYLDAEIIVDEPVYGGIFHEGIEAAGAPCDSMICGGDCGGCGGIGCDSMACAPGCHGKHGWWPCVTLCLPRDGWFSAEYLMWYQKGMRLPPLATRNANGIGAAPNLATPGTEVVFGDDDDYVDGELNGLRLSFGLFLDHCHEWSLAADYFAWDQINENALFLPDGTSSLGRPILDMSRQGAQGAQLVNFTGNNVDGDPVSITGTLGINLSSQLESGGFQLRRFLVCRDGCGDTIFMNLPAAYRSRIDLGMGYRYTQLNEELGITERLTPNGAPAGSFINVFDNFDTQTQFNGFDFGMYYTRHRGLWSLDMQGRFAIGTNRQYVSIRGLTESQLPPAAQVNDQGGLLALPSNIGEYNRDRISILPEFRASIGYRVTPNLKATVGYTFMYWSNVVRPGDQIDLAVNRDSVPRPGVVPVASRFPEFAFNETDYWAQGISFGGEYRW